MASPSDPNISKSFLHKYLQEDSFPGDLRESIISLPKQKGWITPYSYKYKGFWFEPFFLQGAIRSQQHFQAQDSDVIVCSLPKCGTTWLKTLTFALTTRKQHFLVSQETLNPLLTKIPHDLVRNMELAYEKEANPSFWSDEDSNMKLLSTHLPRELLPVSVLESKCKMVYVCRNQKDTFVSLWHFVNKLRDGYLGLGAIPFPEAFDDYCSGGSLFGLGPFWDQVLGYWKESLENPRKVLFLKYEDIKEEPDVQLRRMAEFLGCPFSEEEEECGVISGILRLCSFESLRNLEVNKTGKTFYGSSNSVYFKKGTVGDWKNHLTDEMAKRLDQIVEEKFKGTGLKL